MRALQSNTYLPQLHASTPILGNYLELFSLRSRIHQLSWLKKLVPHPSKHVPEEERGKPILFELHGLNFFVQYRPVSNAEQRRTDAFLIDLFNGPSHALIGN
jgi:hypothetical protein